MTAHRAADEEPTLLPVATNLICILHGTVCVLCARCKRQLLLFNVNHQTTPPSVTATVVESRPNWCGQVFGRISVFTVNNMNTDFGWKERVISGPVRFTAGCYDYIDAGECLLWAFQMNDVRRRTTAYQLCNYWPLVWPQTRRDTARRSFALGMDARIHSVVGVVCVLSERRTLLPIRNYDGHNLFVIR